MMGKLWRKNSYAIILVVFSFVGVLMLSNMSPSSSEDYIKITVSQGETLWEIADKFSDQHDFSIPEFVEWVEMHNGISGDLIIAGDELMIPVENSPIEININEVASK